MALSMEIRLGPAPTPLKDKTPRPTTDDLAGLPRTLAGIYLVDGYRAGRGRVPGQRRAQRADRHLDYVELRRQAFCRSLVLMDGFASGALLHRGPEERPDRVAP